MASSSTPLVANKGKEKSTGDYDALGSRHRTHSALNLEVDLLKTDPTTGLTSEEAKKRLAEFGPNALESAPKESFWTVLMRQLLNGIFLLTAIASCICYLTGDVVKGTILLFLFLFTLFANAIGEYTNADPGAALSAMDAKEASVWRNGVLDKEVPVFDLVPGDVVQLCAGTVVAADMEVISATDIQVDESTLTGESKEVYKFTKADCDKEADSEEKLTKPYRVYKGTDVKSGNGKAIVFATGMQTQVGLIAKRLKDADDDPEATDRFGDKKKDAKDKDDKEPDYLITPLQTSINKLTVIIALCCGFVFVSGTLAGFLLGYQSVPPLCSQTDWACLLHENFIRGLLMATAIIPCGLPLVVMIMLRLASTFLLEKNAMVVKQSAVDYLGAAHVICSDKTGTLTAGVMAVKKFVGIIRSPKTTHPLEDIGISFYPLGGLDPTGGAFPASRLTPAHEHKLDNGAKPDSLKDVPNLADPTKEAPSEFTNEALITHVSLAAAFVHCHQCKINPPEVGTDKWKAEGSTSEAALKVACWKGTKGRLVDKDSVTKVKARYGNTGPKVGKTNAAESLKEHLAIEPTLEIPFNSDRKMAATVHKLPEVDHCLGEAGGRHKLRFKPEHTHVAILKGAPDRIVARLTGMLTVDDGALVIADGKPTEDELKHIKDTNDGLCNEALRTLLMAVRPLTAQDFSDLQTTSQSKTGAADQCLEILLDEKRSGALTFLCMWGIYDPPRATVPASVAQAHGAFIRVVMITGDQMPTAKAIARKVGIIEDSLEGETHVMPCKALHHENPEIARTMTSDALTDPTLKKKVKSERGLNIHDLKTKDDEHEKEYKDTKELALLTKETHVWSRAEPTDKFTIVESLKHQKLKVAMTGDGVNDAPALKKADIGVAMGIAGTPVTQKAASMVLLDDDFSTIIRAVEEGRKIYGNVQKYVIFNLCVKGSECFVSLIAIFCNLPVPIQGVPQLVNLLVSQIIPPVALAWEDAEEYTMTIPPRETENDLIIDRVFMMYRWVPFLLCYALVITPSMCLYTWLNIGFVNVRDIVGSHQYLAVDHGNAACQIAGELRDGDFYADREPFHCKCYTRKNYWDNNPIVTEQWGLFDNSNVDQDRWTGSTGTAYVKGNTPWASGRTPFLHQCKDEVGNDRLCWNNPAAPKPHLSGSMNCAAFGARRADTMAYVSIQLGEMLCLATFRTDGFVGFARWSTQYNVMLAFNFAVLVIILGVPFVNELLGFQPLDATDFLLALIAPVLMVTLSEVAKILFRDRLKQKHDNLRELERNKDTARMKSVDDGSDPEDSPEDSKSKV